MKKNMRVIRDKILTARADILDDCGGRPDTRELSMVVTKLEEAEMWLDRHDLTDWVDGDDDIYNDDE